MLEEVVVVLPNPFRAIVEELHGDPTV